MKRVTQIIFTIVALVMFFNTMLPAQDKKSKNAEVTFSVNMDCKNCVKKLEAKLPFEEGVKDLKVDLDTHTVWFVYSTEKTNKEKLAKAIEKLGYTATISSLNAQSSQGGSLFYEQIRSLSFEEREILIQKEILRGNYPQFLRQWAKVESVEKDSQGQKHHITLFVAPDYMSVGSDSDFFIMPMGPISAQIIADSLNCSLPTPKVVDLIYKNATLKLEPFNFIPRGNRNETPDILNDHSRIIVAQINASNNKPGVFVAGTKKDIVISEKLNDSARTHHVIIYGWHKLDGKAIQPIYNGHINIYVDYSHGVRLVSKRVLIDGREYDYNQVLKDPLLFTLLSNEPEPLKRTSYLSK